MILKTNTLQYKLLNSQRIAEKNTELAIRNITSGKRINTAADDAAGLSISTRLTSLVNDKTMKTRNTQQEEDLLQTADGALSTVHDLLHRLKELSIQSQNGTLNPQDISSLQKEANNILSNIQKIEKNTTYNNIRIFDPNVLSLRTNLAPNFSDPGWKINKNAQIIDDNTLKVSGNGSPFSSSQIIVPATPNTLYSISAKINTGHIKLDWLDENKKSIPYNDGYNKWTESYGGTYAEGVSPPKARYMAILFDNGTQANGDFIVKDLFVEDKNAADNNTQKDSSPFANITSIALDFLGIKDLKLADHNSINQIDNAINLISTNRGNIGGAINTLNYRIDNYNTGIINEVNARARIEDASIEQESSSLLKEEIKIQLTSQLLVTDKTNTEKIFPLLQQ
ncbi:flagellin [Bacillus toyonensis]|uniref:flagellin n=1 Tax=Bacillus toyonensis TaxID=155322 RepID=UPI002E1D3814|nr:flagellin [Bacillus toyonensis]